MEQPLVSKGDIMIGDGAWIGYGVTVLQGVTTGEGAAWPQEPWAHATCPPTPFPPEFPPRS